MDTDDHIVQKPRNLCPLYLQKTFNEKMFRDHLIATLVYQESSSVCCWALQTGWS